MQQNGIKVFKDINLDLRNKDGVLGGVKFSITDIAAFLVN